MSQSPMRARGPSVGRAVAFLIALGVALAAGAGPAAVAPIQQIATYPANNDARVAPDAELYFVFDQPTLKTGSFSVSDLDSLDPFTHQLALLQLQAPRWSALGDTVFLKTSSPMTYGHLHGMRVNTIVAPDPQNSASDLPIIYFTVSPRANVVRAGSSGIYESVSLVPDRAIPVTIPVRETAGTAAYFTSARYRFYYDDEIDLNGGPVGVTASTYVSIMATVPRRGTAALTVPVTIPRRVAAGAGDGLLGLEIVFEGYDETGQSYSFRASSRIRTTAFPGDNTLISTRVQVTPEIGASIAIGSVYLEYPLPGMTFVVGDTLRPRAVVTGIGTGSFRGAFYMDDEFVAFVEGFLESGRPDTVTVPGPLPTRRLGEHRLQFVVESPQNVGASPVTILCVAPPSDRTAAAGTVGAEDRVETSRGRIGINLATLVQAKTPYGPTDGSVMYWSRSTAFAQLGGGGQPGQGARLEASALWRVRLDDTKNGSASPEQVNLRMTTKRGIAEWGDIAPNIAIGAPLLASSVPRRAAQATVNAGGLGTLEGYIAVESHPRSAGGVGREARSDLYAGRLSRSMGSRVRLSAYGGYTHEDPTPGGFETRTRARAIYGGAGSVNLSSSWRWLADIATVRHRTIEGVETGRSRTGVRSEIAGKVVGADLRAEGFRYQPALATELNPYAISDRQGVAFSARRTIKSTWRIFGDYRFEEPSERIGPVSTPFGSYGGVPYVSVERIALGTGLSLGPSAAVTPVLIRIRHRGAQTELTETRLSSEFTEAEPREGRTSAKFDVAIFDDDLGVAKKRKLIAGTFVSMRRHPGNITSTTIIGVENDNHVDLDLVDRTIQGTIELRWDAKPDRFAVLPYVVYTERRLETRGIREEWVSGRLQLMAMQIQPLFGATLAVEGRIGRVNRTEPVNNRDTDYGASLSLSSGKPTLH